MEHIKIMAKKKKKVEPPVKSAVLEDFEAQSLDYLAVGAEAGLKRLGLLRTYKSFTHGDSLYSAALFLNILAAWVNAPTAAEQQAVGAFLFRKLHQWRCLNNRNYWQLAAKFSSLEYAQYWCPRRSTQFSYRVEHFSDRFL